MTKKLHVSPDIEDLIKNISLDYIVESGNNASGSYLKLKNGIMFCWKKVSGTTAINQAWGSGYTSGASNNISLGWWPVSFDSTPTVSIMFERGGLNAWLSSVSSVSKDYAGEVGLLRFTSQNSTEYVIHVIAIGRWKQ